MGTGRSRQRGARTAEPRTWHSPARLGNTLACLALAGTTALACGGTENGDKGTGGNGAESNTSGGTSSTATSPGPIASLDDLLRALVPIVCRSECSDGDFIEFSLERECTEVTTLIYEALGANVERLLDAGTVDLDLGVAQDCVDEWASSPCGSSPAVCEEIFVGQVAIDGACTDSAECAGSAYCDDSLACPGTCVASLAEGAPCSGGGECATGFTCSVDGVCSRLKPHGELCENDWECLGDCREAGAESRCTEEPASFSKGLGEPCTESLECGRDLYCPQDAPDPRSCMAAAEPGEACRALGAEPTCVWTAYCALAAGSDEGVCVEEVPIGSPCTDTKECAGGVCDGGTCEEHSALGEPCVTDERCFGVCESGLCAPEPACDEGG